MMFINKILGKTDENQIVLKKSEESDEWVVQKGFSILYVGTKEKCETYKKHLEDD